MYKVCIYNSDIETIIHYPTSDKSAPHLIAQMPLSEKLSQASTLAFTLPFMNPGYNQVVELATKVKVFDTRDNSVVFSGRILDIKEGMDSNGEFTKECTCESAMGYLNDTHIRRITYTNKSPAFILSDLLSKHNAKVDASRQIQIGTVEPTQNITIDYNYETTLNGIIKLRNILNGDLLVRETNGVLYLDYLNQQGANNSVQIRLGHNQQRLINEYDASNVVTRLIPLGYGEGINQLDITSVNGGLDYIEDTAAQAQYGVIEGQATNKDLQDATTLKIWGQTQLSQNSQPALKVECDMLDLSTIGIDSQLNLGDTAEIINDVMNFDVFARVVEKETDLLAPYNPKLAIDTQPLRLTDSLVEMKAKSLSLENAPQGGVYIDTFGYAENIDADHPFTLPVWLSPDIINVNRVRLHIDGQPYRAYSTATTDNAVINAATADTGDADGTVGVHSHKYAIWVWPHSHEISYGISEDENNVPDNCKVKINGVQVAGPFEGEFSEDIDITQYVSTPGQTYKITISSSQNARVNVLVSIQAFIQSK